MRRGPSCQQLTRDSLADRGNWWIEGGRGCGDTSMEVVKMEV